jgi:hypothetical protein
LKHLIFTALEPGSGGFTMSYLEIIYFSYFALPLALVIGLGLAFRWIRRLAFYYPFPDPGGKSLNHVLLLLAWLALGSLLAGPFVEPSRIIQGIAIFFENFQYSYEPAVAFGLTHIQLQIFIDILKTGIVYAYVGWLGARLYREGQLAFLDQVVASRFERLLLLLVFAGLVDGALDMVWWGVEMGLSNFMDQWVILRMTIALGILAFLILNLAIILARRLEKTEIVEVEEWPENTSSLL